MQFYSASFLRLLMISMLFLTLASCGGSSGDSKQEATPPEQEVTPPEQEVTQPEQEVTSPDPLTSLEESGLIPSLERGSSIRGTDADNDGIRDDVESYIDRNYSGPDEVDALRQTASALQGSLTVDLSDSFAVEEASLAISRAIACAYENFDTQAGSTPAKAIQEIESVTTNTKERLLAYLAYNKSLDGSTVTLSEEDSCE